MLDGMIHLAFVLLFPPLLLGVINKTKAAFAGRVGPPLLQTYYDVAKLLRKGSVFSRTTTWVFRAGPVVGLATTLLVALIVPLGGHAAPLHFEGDFILFAYALALGRFFTVAAALDTGSAFEGMGGAREVAFSCLAEPALFLALLVVARATGTLSLSEMLGPHLAGVWSTAGAALAAVAVSLFVVLLVENCRIPFDDPNTHLELTMIHEVMVLDHGGPALGLIQYGASIKLFVFAALLLGIVVPLGASAPWFAVPALAVALIGVAVAVGVLESVMARLRLTQIPTLLVAASLMSAFGVVLLARS
ncbi:MAG TPA: NADH-quinone oxidoreductase subunit H [Myxococcota bacterium]|nr:NADH-quinone oxidoreductase subunit H [Myxococcota bacterium]